MTPSPKSSVDEIRQRFDADVERFSNLTTGQSATMDAALCLDLVTATVVADPLGERLQRTFISAPEEVASKIHASFIA